MLLQNEMPSHCLEACCQNEIKWSGGGSARPQPPLNLLCCMCTTISISLHILLCSFLLVVFNFLLSFFVKPKLQSAAPWQINLSLRMQNARYRSLNYIYSGVILPDQKFCRIVSDIFSSLYLIFYLEVLLVIICTRLKKFFLISTIVKSQLYDFSLNPSRNMQPNSFTSFYIYIDQQIQILMDILVKMGV